MASLLGRAKLDPVNLAVGIHTQDVSDRLQVGRKGYNGSSVEIAVRPLVQTMANPLNKGVVYSEMAEGALNIHRLNGPCWLKKPVSPTTVLRRRSATV